MIAARKAAAADRPVLSGAADGLTMLPLTRAGAVREGEGSPRGDELNVGSLVYRTGPPLRPKERVTRPQPVQDEAWDDRDTLQAYAAGAAKYDERTDQFTGFRRRVVDALDLRRGDVVADVGCGTGLCMPALQERIGPQGRIIAVDESAAMLDIARARAEQFDWSNVTFILAPAAAVDLPVDTDAALFCAVHDILRSADAVRNILSQLPPGARVASGGGKWAARWLLMLNTYVAALHRPCVRSFKGFDRPWSLLTPYLSDLRITEMAFGTGYIAAGRVPPDPPS
ncbi:MAG: arsenite methyltransferase [Actinomycetota bacterium]|nr:arsenite methyltransferase [Actinomycetota bacterium]